MSEQNTNRLPALTYRTIYSQTNPRYNTYPPPGQNYKNPIMSISNMTEQVHQASVPPLIRHTPTDLPNQHILQLNIQQPQTPPLHNNPQFRGPPKTSRFFKTLPSESNRDSNTSTAHHYNPYLYPQQKTKATPPLDLLNLGTRLTINEEELSSPHLSDSNMIPTYRLTEKQFEDPIKFIESVKDVGAKYGAIKIIPPATWDCQFSINTELFWFRSRRQLLNSGQSELQSRLKFHSKLLKFHQMKNTSLGKLPSIDKRLLDLYRLRICVKLRGGFETVCQRKLWAQIGRELGYSGKIMTSLSSSLKSAYQRYILQFDLYEEKLSSDVNENNKRAAEDEEVGHQSKKYKLNDLLNDDSTPTQESSTPAAEVQTETLKKTPLILGSAKEFNRSRRRLLSKGFPINYDNLTEYKTSITKPDSKTLINYDFYKWFENDIIDTSPFDKKLAPLYNLRQFYDKNLKFQEFILNNYYISKKPTINELEFLYWRFLSDCDINYEVECGIKINSMIHDSGFNILNLNNDSSMNNQSILNNNKKIALHPFNLNNLPVLPNSILSYLSNDCTNIIKPDLSIGMMFSCENWSQEDHYLNMINYHHLGDCKIWYFIPVGEQEKFEKLILKILSENNERENINNVGKSIIEGDFKPCDLEFLNCSLENKIPIDLNNKRLNHTNVHFNKLMSNQTKVQYNQDFFISPEILTDNGIAFFKAVQQPGQYIVKFPQTYSSNISLGFTTSEEVNFATPSWINHAIEGEDWLRKQGIMPNFSSFKLFISIIESCKDVLILKQVEPVFNKLVTEELEMRETFRETFANIKEVPVDDDDIISDDDVTNCFPSKIVLFNNEQSFIMNPTKFLNNYKSKLDELSVFTVEFQLYYSDDKLKNYLKVLQSNLIDKNDWLLKFNEILLSSYRPSLKSLKLLSAESERINDSIPEATYLKNFLNDANKFIDNCQNLLSIKHQQRIRGSKRKQSTDKPKYQENTLYRLTSLIDEIPKLNFHCAEMDQLIEFQQEIENFEKSVRNFLSDKGHSVTEFDDMINLGESFGIELNSIKFLTRLRDAEIWLEKVKIAIEDTRDLDELKELYQEGSKILGKGHATEYEKLKNHIIKSEVFDKQIEERLSADSINIKELELFSKSLESKVLALSVENTEKLDELYESHYEVYGKIDEFIQKGVVDYATIAPIFKKLDTLKMYKKSDEIDTIKNHINNAETWISKFQDRLQTTNLSKQLNMILQKNQFNFSIIIRDLYEKSETDPDYNKIFCLCREYESGTMIECEICKEWYHVRCLKLNGLKDDYIFNCPICDDTFKIEPNLKKLDISEFEEFSKQGEALVVQPSEEIETLSSILKDYKSFKGTLYTDLKWSEGSLVEDDINKLKFYLRKICGSYLEMKESTVLKSRIDELIGLNNNGAPVQEKEQTKEDLVTIADPEIVAIKDPVETFVSDNVSANDRKNTIEGLIEEIPTVAVPDGGDRVEPKVEEPMHAVEAAEAVRGSATPKDDMDGEKVGVVFKFDPFNSPAKDV